MFSKGESAFSVAHLLHVRKLTLRLKSAKVFLYGDCCVGNRCGTICRHKFKVYHKFLQYIGFKDFDHKSVHCINWNSYHFLGNKQSRDFVEKEAWEDYQQCVKEGFQGTLCGHNHPE